VDPPVPPSAIQDYPYGKLIAPFSKEERILVGLALLPVITPYKLNFLHEVKKVLGEAMDVTGITREKERFVPTFQTALFVLSGYDVEKQIKHLALFDRKSLLFKKGILVLPTKARYELDSLLLPTKDFTWQIITGEPYEPPYSERFPAEPLLTTHTWEDLVLSEAIQPSIEKIKKWLQLGGEPYRLLFVGAPGTGKTLTATLLAKENRQAIYVLDAHQLTVSYHSDTEQVLVRLFQRAEINNWLLVFDQAEYLLRSPDKERYFALRTWRFLWHQINQYSSNIIFCTNVIPLQLNESTKRRFQAIIPFRVPNEKDRLILWEKYFKGLPQAFSINYEALAKEYEITGAMIAEVRAYALRDQKLEAKEELTEHDIARALMEVAEKYDYDKQ
ncbi:MAG: AAA family ATPase, partial [Bacteroidota bacterium]